MPKPPAPTIGPDSNIDEIGREKAERIARWLKRGRRARERTLRDRIIDLRCHWEAGRRLHEWRKVLKEDRLWCKWIRDNEDLLGFRTRQRAGQYIRFYEKNGKPAFHLLDNEDEVVRLELALRGKSPGLLAKGTDEPNWFTQKDVIAAAREVMGGIDVDPATHAEAQKDVRANRAFTKEDNGLEQGWPGRVWINPPYRERRPKPEHEKEEGKGSISDFAAKLIESYKTGVTTQAIWLSNIRPKKKWWNDLMATASLVCLVERKLTFRNPKREKLKPSPYEHAIFYLGDHYVAFEREFSQFGMVYRPFYPEEDFPDGDDYDDL
jgi:hypothetical protein